LGSNREVKEQVEREPILKKTLFQGTKNLGNSRTREKEKHKGGGPHPRARAAKKKFKEWGSRENPRDRGDVKTKKSKGGSA